MTSPGGATREAAALWLHARFACKLVPGNNSSPAIALSPSLKGSASTMATLAFRFRAGARAVDGAALLGRRGTPAASVGPGAARRRPEPLIRGSTTEASARRRINYVVLAGDPPQDQLQVEEEEKAGELPANSTHAGGTASALQSRANVGHGVAQNEDPRPL